MDRKQPVGSDFTASHRVRPQRGSAFLSAASRALNSVFLWQARIDERHELACVDERLL